MSLRLSLRSRELRLLLSNHGLGLTSFILILRKDSAFAGSFFDRGVRGRKLVGESEPRAQLELSEQNFLDRRLEVRGER